MLKGLILKLTIPCTNLYSVYLAVACFKGPTLCHLGYYPVIWCCTASRARILEVTFVSGGITVPTLWKLDHCYQRTSTLTWCISKSFYRAIRPARPLDPVWIINQHLS